MKNRIRPLSVLAACLLMILLWGVAAWLLNRPILPGPVAVMAKMIRHKANIEVNRYGTKAEAVAEMMMYAGEVMMPEWKEVSLDRPYVYAIVHHETMLPVFMGIVNWLETLGDPAKYLTNNELDGL